MRNREESWKKSSEDCPGKSKNSSYTWQTKGEDSRHRNPNLISFRVSFGAEEPWNEQRPDQPGRELTADLLGSASSASISFNMFRSNIRISKNYVSISLSLSLSTCIIMYHMISCRIMCKLKFYLKYWMIIPCYTYFSLKHAKSPWSFAFRSGQGAACPEDLEDQKEGCNSEDCPVDSRLQPWLSRRVMRRS